MTDHPGAKPSEASISARVLFPSMSLAPNTHIRFREASILCLELSWVMGAI